MVAPRVLIVDDEFLIRWALRETLAGLPFETVEADSCRQALLQAQAGQEDPIRLAILDQKLPDGDGWSLIDPIRKLSPACQFLLITAYETPGVREEATRRGVDTVLIKPFRTGEVLAFARRALRGRKGP